jgi:ABC-type Fe3+ transport system substrate-binding protein
MHGQANVTRGFSILLACLPAGSLLAGGCAKAPTREAASKAEASKSLTIITPHSAKIREAIEMGFGDWYKAKRGGDVNIYWIDRGTPRCVEYITTVFGAPADVGRRGTPDIMFGGGIVDHQTLADRNFCRVLKLDDALAGIPTTAGGLPTRSPEGRWFATDLSSFGIIYHDQDCRKRGIAPPATWSDLADPRFRGWLGVADPAASGSHSQCLMLILQDQGWEKGWATIIRILANARALADSSTDVLRQVKSGVFLAGFTVSFDGLALMDESRGKLKYTSPAGATAITPGVTSVLKSASDRALAEDFVRYCLSDEAQILWGVHASERASYGDTLYHYPVKPAVYDEYAGKLAVRENPFEANLGIRVDLIKGQLQIGALNALIPAVCGENHILLQQAWEDVVKSGMQVDALAELTAVPFDEETAYRLGQEYAAAESAAAAEMIAEWTELFRTKYGWTMEKAHGG